LQLSPYEIAIIAGCFTIAGVLLGAWIAHRSSVHLLKIHARREAGSKLRAAFAPEIAKVRLARVDESIDVEATLKSAFGKHAAAIEEYRPFVKTKDVGAYQKAWQEYYDVGGGVRFFDYYMGDNAQELFEHRINSIFKFTEI